LIDVDELKEKFLNFDFDIKEFNLQAGPAALVAEVSGEIRESFLDINHPDFSIHPAFIGSLSAGRHLPIDFPNLGGIPMDGGKCVTIHQLVRPGVPITGRTHLHDIYDKSGRSGRMIFIVTRMELFDDDGVHLATSDSRMVIRERGTD
tara:strand:- start:675 stop:1118 length:444 start_codon:yes stop_codon:yes gene_type:complete